MALQLITQPLRTVHPNKNNSRKTTTPSPPTLKKKQVLTSLKSNLNNNQTSLDIFGKLPAASEGLCWYDYYYYYRTKNYTKKFKTINEKKKGKNWMLWYLQSGHSWKQTKKQKENKLYIPLIICFFIAAVLLLLNKSKQKKQKQNNKCWVCVQKGGYEFRDF